MLILFVIDPLFGFGTLDFITNFMSFSLTQSNRAFYVSIKYSMHSAIKFTS